MALTRRGLVAAWAAGDSGESLFDGKSFTGWTLADGAPVTHSWAIEAGVLATVPGRRERSDLLCGKPVRAFQLEFEFRLSSGANTGVKYFVQQALRYVTPGSPVEGSYGAVGLEFQLATDDSEGVEHADQRMGAVYGLLPAQVVPVWKPGEWNTAKLVCLAEGCEHWINGRRVLAYDPASAEFKQRLREAALDPRHSIVGSAAALVALRRRPGAMPPALISLQHHASKAWFRALRLRSL